MIISFSDRSSLYTCLIFRCTDSSQCEGRCDYKPLVSGGTSEVIGQCQVTIPSSNCYQEMRAGRVGPKICP
jgi:hypothetical protein